MDRLVRQTILSEAHRPVSVREGERISEMPTLQATLRSLGLAAVKGNRVAGKLFVDLAQKAEDEDRAERLEQFRAAIEHKAYWEMELRRHRERGLPEPEVFPHPDDMVFDWATGEVDVLGPISPEENERYVRLIDLRNRCEEMISESRFELKCLPEHRLRIEGMMRDYEALYDFANGQLLGRYRSALLGRLSPERDVATAEAEIRAQRAKLADAQASQARRKRPAPHLI